MIYNNLEKENVLKMLKGDESAAEFISMMGQALHFWDDLIDKDAVVSDEHINKMFFNMLVELPRNKFYNAHFTHLNAILVNSITNWHIANKMEHSGEEYQERIAYILRSSYIDLLTQSALLVGGIAYGEDIGYTARMITHNETWGGYKENLAAEKAARAEKE